MLMFDILSGHWLSEYKQTPKYTHLVRVNYHLFHFTYKKYDVPYFVRWTTNVHPRFSVSFLVGSVLLIFLVCCVVFLYIVTFLIQLCHFRIKTMVDSSLPPVLCTSAHVLFMLFVFLAYSGIQHILCCVFVFSAWKRWSVLLYTSSFCFRSGHVLFMLFVFPAYNGIQHILCCVFVLSAWKRWSVHIYTTSFCYWKCTCLIYVICVYLRIVVYNRYCVVL